ncbi:MAG: hypothetical protein ACKVGZ_19725, partial [Alphaproteobacteria bacterium]
TRSSAITTRLSRRVQRQQGRVHHPLTRQAACSYCHRNSPRARIGQQYRRNGPISANHRSSYGSTLVHPGEALFRPARHLQHMAHRVVWPVALGFEFGRRAGRIFCLGKIA